MYVVIYHCLASEINQVSGTVSSVEADKEAIASKLSVVEESIDDIIKSYGVLEAKTSNVAFKADKLESDVMKGTMILKNLEEKKDTGVKEQLATFFKDVLKIAEEVPLVTAFRMGKEPSQGRH